MIYDKSRVMSLALKVSSGVTLNFTVTEVESSLEFLTRYRSSCQVQLNYGFYFKS